MVGCCMSLTGGRCDFLTCIAAWNTFFNLRDVSAVSGRFLPFQYIQTPLLRLLPGVETCSVAK